MIQATINNFEENYAHLVFENGDTITLHIDELPEDAGEGSIIYFHPSLEQELKHSDDNLAKNILNQILKKN